MDLDWVNIHLPSPTPAGHCTPRLTLSPASPLGAIRSQAPSIDGPGGWTATRSSSHPPQSCWCPRSLLGDRLRRKREHPRWKETIAPLTPILILHYILVVLCERVDASMHLPYIPELDFLVLGACYEQVLIERAEVHGVYLRSVTNHWYDGLGSPFRMSESHIPKSYCSIISTTPEYILVVPMPGNIFDCPSVIVQEQSVLKLLGFLAPSRGCGLPLYIPEGNCLIIGSWK